MTQPTDIMLDGAGYMLAPGGYRRSQDGIAEGRTGRVTMQDFFGGQRRVLQLERDRGWGGIGTGAALDGQGVAPWPHVETVSLAATSEIPVATQPIPTATVNDHVFFAIGAKLYRTVSLSAPAWAAPAEVWDSGGPAITALAWYNDDLLIALGDAADLVVFQYPAGPAATLLAGEKGRHVAGYAGFALWSRAQIDGATGEIRMVTGSGVESRYLDARVTQLTTAGGKVWAASNTSLYSFTGRVRETLVPNPAWTSGSTDPTSIPALRWSGEWDPFFQHGTWSAEDDYTFLLGFGGRLITWLGKRVVEHTPSGDRAGWRDLGLGGRSCRGACVAGVFLVVAIEATDGASEVWAWNGAGWWLVLRDATGAAGWMWPIGLSGAGSHDVLLFRDGSLQVELLRLLWRSASDHALAAGGGSYVTSLLDAGERDREKAWRAVGATFTSPEPLGDSTSAAPVTISLDWSADAGTTWATAASRAVLASDGAVDLTAGIASDAAVSRFAMLRVTWTGVVDWAPVLTGLWVEFESLDAPARRRRWEMTVLAHDQVVRRDGGAVSQTGRELIAALWTAWETGTTLPFHDIDHDTEPTERRVRIVGIRERVARPTDAGEVGDAIVELTLVEV
jgi:hypothetical protein